MPFPRKRHSRTTNRDVFLSPHLHHITKYGERKEQLRAKRPGVVSFQNIQRGGVKPAVIPFFQQGLYLCQGG